MATLWPWAVPVLAWWLSPALPTVLNHIPSLVSQSQLSHPRPRTRPLGSSSDLAQSGWAARLELTSQQVSLGRGGHEQTGPWCRPCRAKKPLGSCVWLLESPPRSRPPPPPRYSNGEGDCCFTVVVSTVAFLHPGRVSGGWDTPGPQAGSCLQSSVPHTGDPLRTPPNFILQRGPEAPSCCLQRPWGTGRNGGCLCVCNHQLTAGSVAWGFSFNLIFNT